MREIYVRAANKATATFGELEHHMQGKLQKSPKNLQLEHNPLATDLPDGKENDEKKD